MKSNNKLLIFLLLASILGCLPFVFQSEKAEANRVANNTGAVALAGALDAYTRPPFCWSLRREFSAYTGPLVRLRRSSDNAELDFTTATGSYWIDVAAIESWASGSNIYIAKFYNIGTVGSSGDCAESNATLQYQLGASGTVYTEGTNLRPYFIKTNNIYETTSSTVFDFMFDANVDISVVTLGHNYGVGATAGGSGTTGSGTAYLLFYLNTGNRMGWVAVQNGTTIISGFHAPASGTKGAAWIWRMGTEVETYWNGSTLNTHLDTDSFTNPVTPIAASHLVWGPTLFMHAHSLLVYDSDIGDTDAIAISSNLQSDWGF